MPDFLMPSTDPRNNRKAMEKTKCYRSEPIRAHMGPDRGCLTAATPLDASLPLAVILADIRATAIERIQAGARRPSSSWAEENPPPPPHHRGFARRHHWRRRRERTERGRGRGWPAMVALARRAVAAQGEG
jgi:hypothetical protein